MEGDNESEAFFLNVLSGIENGDAIGTNNMDEIEEENDAAVTEIRESFIPNTDTMNIQEQFEQLHEKLKITDINKCFELFNVDPANIDPNTPDIVERAKMELYILNDYLHGKLASQGQSFPNKAQFARAASGHMGMNLKIRNYSEYELNNQTITDLWRTVNSFTMHMLKPVSTSDNIVIDTEPPNYGKSFPSNYFDELVLFIQDNRYKKMGRSVVQNIPGTTTWEKVYHISGKPLTIEGLVSAFEGYKYHADKDFYNRHVDPNYHKKFTSLLKKTDVGFFDTLDYSRFAYQFNNGVYIANNIELPRNYFCGNTTFSMIKPSDTKGRFIRKGTAEYHKAQSNIFTSSQSELDFDDSDYDHWSDIQTPYLDMILDYQEFPEDAKKWMYILLGRALYPLTLFDRWELVVFLFGVAGCGKSRILDTISQIVGREHVGAITATVQRDFILGDLKNSRLVVADEVKEDFPLGASTFQSMASGNVINTANKFEDLETAPWKVGMLFAGNTKPQWRDESSISITRRMVVFQFLKSYINETDNPIYLEAGLKNELALILRKINEAYLEAVVQYAGIENIQSMLPTYFSDTIREYQTDNNYIAQSFDNLCNLSRDPPFTITDDESNYITFNDFKDACKNHGIRLKMSTKETDFIFTMKVLRYTVSKVGQENRILKIKKNY